MNERLSIDLMLTALLVTTFTSVGVLALWVATSPRHWFLRAVTALALLSTLLLIPAYEPLLTFGLIISIVVVGVATYRLWRRMRHNKLGDARHLDAQPKSRWQFSIKSAIAMCTCLAVLIAILARVPPTAWLDWRVTGTAGLSIALLALIAAWIVYGSSTRRERLGSGVAVSAVLIGSAVSALQNSVPAPQFLEEPLLAFTSIDEHFKASRPQLVVLLLIAAGSFATLIVILCLVRGNDSRRSHTSASRIQYPIARLSLILWSLLMLGPPLLMLIALVRPLPLVDRHLPTPNGYDELARIGQRFRNSALWNEVVGDHLDEAKVDAAVPSCEADFVALRNALDMPFGIPIHYDMATDLVKEDFQSIMDLAYVLDAKAGAAMRSGNPDESLACRMANLRLAQSISRSGLLVNFLRANAIESDENAQIYRGLPAMKSAQLKTAIRELADYDQHREPFEKIRERQLVWDVKTQGWPQHIRCVFDNLSPQSLINDCDHTICRLDQAVNRLLRIEMALRLYHADHARFPAALGDLVPTYITELPTDPFASGAPSLHYIVSPGEFRLWSVGPDGRDNEGEPLSPNADGGNDLHGNGDLELRTYYLPRGE